MTLRVVTVAYNPGEEMDIFLSSIPQALHEPYEIVIVNNGEDSSLVSKLAEKHDATLINAPGNLGYGKAVNLGVEDFTGEWFFVINPDVVLTEHALDELLKETSNWPKGAAFGPLTTLSNGDVYPSARHFPRIISGGGHAVLTRLWPGNPFSRRYQHNDVRYAHQVDWLSGACLLVRRKAFEDVGCFDPRYFMFFEDVALGQDFHNAGWMSVFVPSSIIVHDHGASWKSRPEAMIRAHHESAARYIDDVYSRPWQAPLRWAVRGGLRLRAKMQVRASLKNS
ncbi:glycosyltransferase family 2 protein [Actinotignum urinale]|uniref:glycosyltransferase family 2 protein n=1 Tax=Actinotignum urinale TaxID=190146 RepID=UPI002A7F84A3|nr:glycosyltransferase family 2 protein [Actinotignum urinale]MDY5151392.1 glycosyltransferase family 2 protein [Actinotignum urinale]